MKWALWLLWDPVRALDLTDGHGRIDHGKIVGFFTFLLMLAVVLVYVFGKGNLLPLGHTIALISASFGWVGWRAFLSSRVTRVREERKETGEEVRYPFGAPTYVFEEGPP